MKFRICATILLLTLFVSASAFAGGLGDISVNTKGELNSKTDVNVGSVESKYNVTGYSGLQFTQEFGSSPEQKREIPFITGPNPYQLMPGSVPVTSYNGFNLIPLEKYFAVKNIFSWEEVKRLKDDSITIYYRRYLPPEFRGRSEYCIPIKERPRCYYVVAMLIGRVIDGENNTAVAADTMVYWAMVMGANRFLPIREGVDFKRETEGNSTSGYAGITGIIHNATGLGAAASRSNSENTTADKTYPHAAGFAIWVDDEKGGK